MSRFIFRTAVVLAAVLCFLSPCRPGLLHGAANDNKARNKTDNTPQNLVNHGGYALSVNDSMTVTHNSDTSFVPASTIKLVTGLAALDILGPDHRFSTRIFSDEEHNLYIQGNGDPFLLTENISAIACQLRETGIERINNLILDDSAWQISGQADGNDNTANPYDAWNSGLAVNFNSIAIQVAKDHSIAADDPKVPLLPITHLIGARLPPGSHHVNVNTFAAASGQLSNTLRYTGELFRALLEQEQVVMQGDIIQGTIPAEARPILTHWSEKTVREMLQQCLKYSNNFVANQLFLACGAARLGAPATWGKARVVLQTYIKEDLGLKKTELTMIEGSGLSRQNLITPRAMLSVLKKFAPYQDLLSTKHGVPLKTGTLTGVYCYAGYLPQQENAPFAILLNQPQNNRDEVLRLLMHHNTQPPTLATKRP
jgi:D-alanyl-D-alanine carboxypeptidase/D-alanyl-D-alanine-endopeptidase (penicillin-binding protein 4)